MRGRTAIRRLAMVAMTGVVLAWSLTACAPTMMTPPPSARPMAQPMAGPSNPPVIEDSFAVSTIPMGALWNVFIQASDPDGDMSHLWVVVTQPGKREVTENIQLVGSDQRAFSGHITVYPRGAFFSAWENLRVVIRIRDRAGNLSARAEHEVQMGWQTREMLPAKWADATRHRLGTILFNLENDNGDPHMGIRGR